MNIFVASLERIIWFTEAAMTKCSAKKTNRKKTKENRENLISLIFLTGHSDIYI